MGDQDPRFGIGTGTGDEKVRNGLGCVVVLGEVHRNVK